VIAKRHVLGLVALLAFAGLALPSLSHAVPGGNAVNPANRDTLAVPVAGTLAGGGGGGGNTISAQQEALSDRAFVGTFNVSRFVEQNGQVMAVGTLVGTARDTSGELLGTVVRAGVAMPLVLPEPGSVTACESVNLELGSIELSLLGVAVELDRVVLNISAEPGAGNLDNLLCAIASLFNGGGNLSQLIASLNQLLSILA
jgi:hypothetical protein